MKVLPIITIVAALALALGAMSTICTLHSLNWYIDRGVYTLEELSTGHLHQILFEPMTWRQIPYALENVHVYWLINLRAFLVKAVFTVGLLLLWRWKGWQDHTVAGLLVLGSAAVPWTVGMVVLAGNTDPSSSGPWLSMMVVSLFYACVACIGLCAYDLFRARRRARGKIRTAPAAA
ncbi:MAG: hypothetical protein V3U11_02765 [Planctomycetota bacterium]